MMSGHGTCVRCLYDARIPSIDFDAHGLCNYCRMHDQMDVE